MSIEKTLFEKIIEGEIPAEILYEDEHCFVINDKFPRAPVHLLVIPKKPIPTLAHATAEDQMLLGYLLLKVGDVARQMGVDDACRVVINVGEKGGQSIFHLHCHLMAGDDLSEENM